MKIDNDSLNVQHNQEKGRFEIRIGEMVAVLDYFLRNNIMTIVHTGVPKELEGQGIGSNLVRAGLEFAQESGFRIVPHCSFVRAYIRRHPEYKELVM